MRSRQLVDENEREFKFSTVSTGESKSLPKERLALGSRYWPRQADPVMSQSRGCDLGVDCFCTTGPLSALLSQHASQLNTPPVGRS